MQNIHPEKKGAFVWRDKKNKYFCSPKQEDNDKKIIDHETDISTLKHKKKKQARFQSKNGYSRRSCSARQKKSERKKETDSI